MNEKINVLLVEDEQTLAMIIKDTLDTQGFRVMLASDGLQGLEMMPTVRPDVVVADVMMPRMDGFEMVRHLRRTDQHTPVLMLTARSAVTDVVRGFELGANDYLKKPFGMQELIVRIRALLGRASLVVTAPAAPVVNKFNIGDQYLFDATAQRLTHVPSGTCNDLSYRESEILRHLCAAAGNVVTSQSLLLQLWGDDSFFNNKSLHVFITKLRHRLSADPAVRIVNVRGVGYKLIGM